MAGSAWFFMALGAAIFWGASYALTEQLFKNHNITPYFIIFAQTLMFIVPTFLFAASQGTLTKEIEAIFNNKTALITLCIIMLLNLSGWYLILTSVSLKNASLSNLIEISYPFFTILFAWLLTKELQITPSMLIGGFLIFTGVAIIYLKS